MNDLILFEQGLVPVYTTDTGEHVVNGRELWEGLNNKSKFADWIKNKLSDCEAKVNEDFETLSKNLENGGRTKEYIIKLDTAKEIAMLENNAIGKQVRKYFIAVEKKSKQAVGTDILDGLSTEMKAILMQDRKMQVFESRVDKLENTMTVDYGQAKEIESIRKSRAIAILGGIGSLAYQQLSGKVFRAIGHDYKDYFNINAYSNTPAARFAEAKQYLKNWMPDNNLQLEINAVNRGNVA